MTTSKSALAAFTVPCVFAIILLILQNQKEIIDKFEQESVNVISIRVGVPEVIDGDTITILEERIRLHGIDAPEASQLCNSALGEEYRCGQEAAVSLDQFIGGRIVVCEPLSRDRYGRTVARCALKGKDVGEWLAENGWAVASTRYSHDYVAAEARARDEKRGIWSGSFISPENWRKGSREKR